MNEDGEDMALKLLHTADWHIGRRHPSFDDESERKLTRARLDVIDRILGAAETCAVDAVLCAGDLFDRPSPEKEWWEPLLKKLHDKTWTDRRMFLLPGNHDPLGSGESPYHSEHPFRRQLPHWVQVVDRDNQEFELNSNAVLYASPCRSTAGSGDLAAALPKRAPGDQRIRIGMLHGQTSGFGGRESNFPISTAAARQGGFDYLALGDLHECKTVADPPPVVYCGAPEPVRMGEGVGHIVLVFFRRSGGAPLVQPQRVGQWRWMTQTCQSMQQLRAIRELQDLETTVLRLKFDLSVSVVEMDEVNAILSELRGTAAVHARAGVLDVDRDGLRQAAPTPELAGPLPKLFAKVQQRLMAMDADDKVRSQAILHLYKLLRAEENGPCA